MTADSSIVDAKAVSEKETVSETLTVYDGKAFKGGGALLTDSLVVKAHGQSTAAVKDTDYTVDYTDGLLTITLKGSLAAAESIDIIITRTLEGCVKIVPLLEGGGIPDAAMLAKVLDVVNAKDIRPLTDKVSAVPPEVETYDIEIVYYTTPESEAEVIANVEGTGGAIDRYNEWQVAAPRPGHQPRPAPQADPLAFVGREPDRRLPRGRRQADLQGPRRHASRQVQRPPDCQPQGRERGGVNAAQ